jgi:hypothetical protein
MMIGFQDLLHALAIARHGLVDTLGGWILEVPNVGQLVSIWHPLARYHFDS